MAIFTDKDLEIVVRLVDQVKTDSSHLTNIDTRLMEDAAIDSLSLIDVVDAVQQETEVTFLPEDYSFEKLQSVRSIVLLVGERRGH